MNGNRPPGEVWTLHHHAQYVLAATALQSAQPAQRGLPQVWALQKASQTYGSAPHPFVSRRLQSWQDDMPQVCSLHQLAQAKSGHLLLVALAGKPAGTQMAS